MADQDGTGQAKGPDNNKRLAFLEGQHRMLADFFGMAPDRFKLNEGEDPIDGILRVAAELSAALAQATTNLASLEADLAEARRSLTAQKGAATKARNEAEVLKLERSPKGRKIGRPRALFGKPAVPFDAELARLAIDEGEVEIVFSDGKAEIVELAPIRVGGDAWRRGARGYGLIPSIELEPGEMDAPEVKVAGFGILAAGEQIGWQELPEPIVVRRNSRVLLDHVVLI